MTWNTTEGATPSQNERTTLSCNGRNYDITGLSGLGLVDKLKAVARENGISKFDVYDETDRNLSSSDIETGKFTGDLTVIRFNVAA